MPRLHLNTIDTRLNLETLKLATGGHIRRQAQALSSQSRQLAEQPR